MCVIVAQPKGTQALSVSSLGKMFDANPDGAGYMFVRDGEVIVRKPYWDVVSLMADYFSDFAAHGKQSPFVLHFRWCTHGELCKGNTHPHVLIPGKVALVHNGILPVTPPDPKM